MSKWRRIAITVNLFVFSWGQAVSASHINQNTTRAFEGANGTESGSASQGSCNPQSSILKLEGENSAGSGTLVHVPEGFAVPSGYYVLTAEHVIKQQAGPGGPVLNVRKANEAKPNLSSMKATNTATGMGFNMNIGTVYRPKSKGEAVLIPVPNTGGITPLRLSSNLEPVSGRMDSYGHAGGQDEVSHAGLKKGATDSFLNLFTLGGSSNTTKESGTFASGVSGGPVLNDRCDLVGVNSATSSIGDKAMISSLRDLLTNPERQSAGNVGQASNSVQSKSPTGSASPVGKSAVAS